MVGVIDGVDAISFLVAPSSRVRIWQNIDILPLGPGFFVWPDLFLGSQFRQTRDLLDMSESFAVHNRSQILRA